METTKRQVVIFSAGCSVCQKTVDLITDIAGPSDQVTVVDMHERIVTRRAKLLGISSVPAVLVDGKLIVSGPDAETLRAAGIGS